jgi:carbamoyltransferase
VTAILGISAFYHDSAAALVVDGEIVAAVQEERFTREKYDADFPANAIAYCLQEGGVTADRLTYVAFYDKPLTKFERLLETYFAYAPAGFPSFKKAMPLWLKRKLFMRRLLRQGLPEASQVPHVFLDHHESHAASAFFPSPYDAAAILTVDGVGEWSTATYGTGEGNRIRLTHHLQFPHSLGLLYSAFTYYCGFTVNSGEYKLMGLAPYGRPVYQDVIVRHLIDLKSDGSLWLNMDYFNYCQGLTMTNERFHQLFGGPPRRPESALEQRHMDLAASIQAITEEIMLRMGHQVHRQTGMKHLVLAGGVALNCVANGRLLREGPFESLWIQPAAGDAGGALGAALFVWYQLLEKPRTAVLPDGQRASLLGPHYSVREIEKVLNETGAVYHQFPDEDALLEHVVQAMIEEKAVGWFHGRTEFGPRALGARSIIGDARSATMQATLNLKIKFRESFRPFAPCVLREHVHEWFAMRPSEDSAYMLLVAPVLDQHRVPLSPKDQTALATDPDLLRRVNLVRSTVPAITHVDYSARVQTVDERHARYQRLMRKFYERTGCPVIINTSFNLSWEPIVLTPRQAYHTFMQSELDVLVLEDLVLHKTEQPLGLKIWATPNDGLAGPDPDPATPWADPVTGDPLVVTATGASNPVTGATYPVEDGIPRLFVPTEGMANGQDVTDLVKQFYEKTPFPNYDDLDTHRALMEKARRGLFARCLSEQIPYDARVLEIGCGTGQLTNFLSIAHRTVLGVDVCLNSLRLAQQFKTEQGLDRAAFAQMNLFRPALKDNFFDIVISNGVLHHTSDCRGAFRRITRLAKPGGYVVVGLYNYYSRTLVHYPRVALYRWTGLTGRWLDPHFGRISADSKREAWFRDQYCHPHETCHTLDEVLRWMDEDGLDFVNSIPKPTPGPALTPGEELFQPRDPGTAWSRLLSQLQHVGSGYREGGFFIMIGRRRAGRTG